MESMLKEILKAEKKAREAALEAEKYKNEVLSELEKEKQQIKEHFASQAEKEIAKMREEHHLNIVNAMQTKEAEAKAKIDAMQRLDRENHEKWVSELFDLAVKKEV